MKLNSTPFTVLQKDRQDLNHKNKLICNYWYEECKKHPTSKSCTIYCS